jgi:hypothetical protein
MLSNIYGIKNGKKENMLNENLREYKIKWIFHNQLLKKLIQTYKNKHVNKLHKFITFKKVVKFPSILKSSHFQHIMINYKVWSQI